MDASTTPREDYETLSKEQLQHKWKTKKKQKPKKKPVPSPDLLREMYPQGKPIPYTPRERPAKYTLLASACLLGHNVRWNGREMSSQRLKKWACENDIELIPVCPETECMGCPRSSFGLHYDEGTVKAFVGSKKRGTRRDVKPALDAKCREIHARHPEADGFIGIDGSPTCGISVGVKKLGNCIKGSMHVQTEKPSEIVSRLWSKNRNKGAVEGETQADVFLRRIDHYRATGWSSNQRPEKIQPSRDAAAYMAKQKQAARRSRITVTYESDSSTSALDSSTSSGSDRPTARSLTTLRLQLAVEHIDLLEIDN